MATISEMLGEVRRHQRAGDAAPMEELCRAVLREDPGNIEALHLLGGAMHLAGRLAEAVDHYQKAARIDQTRAEIFNDLGAALAMMGRLDDAAAAFERAMQLRPDLPDAHNNLGNVRRSQGRAGEAMGHYHEALRLRPNYAQAHFNLGVLMLDQDRVEQAIGSLQKALVLSPNYSQALDTLQRVLKMNPGFPMAQNNLGNWLAQAGRMDEAIAAYEQCLRLKPDFAEAYGNMGNVFSLQARFDQAAASYERAVALKPDYARAHSNLGNVWKERGRPEKAMACYRRVRELDPGDPVFHGNMVVAMMYDPRTDRRSLFEEQRRWDTEHARPVARGDRPHRNDPAPDRRLRVGYVSPDFRGHVVGRNIWPLMRNHDHQQFEITLYASQARADPLTDQFRRCADRWCDIHGWPDERAAEQIEQDRIDVLVDLALHTTGNRLLVLARKPAPVQVTFAGYPGSTGLSAIDYRLTDPYLDPPGLNDAWYSEQSYRLPHSFWCYDPQGEEPPVGELPALTNGFVTFGCLNNFAKVNDGVLECWAEILRAVNGSRLVLLAEPGSCRQRTLDLLAAHGVASERVEFHAFKRRTEYLALYHRVDLGLDTFPYNGHTTSLDSYWMGVPVVTRVGETVVGRAGLSQLTNLGIPELAATTTEDYVRLAVNLAADLPRLKAIRAGLRERMKTSPLMDAVGFARGIEAAYRTMWRKWCADQSR